MSVLTIRTNSLSSAANGDAADHPAATPRAHSNAELIQFPVMPAAAKQRIVAVEFQSRDGRSWNAIGGGATVAEAIDWARECCPDGTIWDAVSWNDLYGD